MVELSQKPYLIRAIHAWCVDSGLTPYLRVKVDSHTRVPMEYVKEGEIVLSISPSATRNLTIGSDMIQFSARFNGVSREITVPLHAVTGVFSRETGQGLFFDPEAPREETNQAPTLASVPTSEATLPTAAPVAAGETNAGAPPPKPTGTPRGKLRVIK